MTTTKTTAPVICDSFAELPEALRALSIPLNRAMLVGDTHTMPLYGEEVRTILSEVFSETACFAFEAGEEHKTLDSVKALLAYLIDNHYDRKDCIIALGGGVVGDMSGFAASIYLRGIRVIQLPTTLLAQVDSSIGGKTGVDFDGYKNMIGAFHFPELVYSNSSALSTLPAEQFRAGMGEVIKTALLADEELFSWLEAHPDEILSCDRETLRQMITRTAGIKVDIVHRDPTEQGERALLNLGHTIGHAIEKAAGFSLLHGDCVGIGLLAAAEMSIRRGLLTAEAAERIRSLCARFGLPAYAEGLDAEEVLRLTKSDKKMQKGQIRFVLLEKIGKAFYVDNVTDEELLSGIRSVLR